MDGKRKRSTVFDSRKRKLRIGLYLKILHPETCFLLGMLGKGIKAFSRSSSSHIVGCTSVPGVWGRLSFLIVQVRPLLPGVLCSVSVTPLRKQSKPSEGLPRKGGEWSIFVWKVMLRELALCSLGEKAMGGFSCCLSCTVGDNRQYRIKFPSELESERQRI